VTIVEPGPIRTAFADAATAIPPRNDDYADSVGKALEWFEKIGGQQPNDPARVARAIIEAVEADKPPLKLALGEEAVQAIREKLDVQRRELDTWAELSATAAITS
jgi:NAD(P)-dependent dehydrogenase (short-subunit alcohol dehydrogenase family)